MRKFTSYLVLKRMQHAQVLASQEGEGSQGLEADNGFHMGGDGRDDSHLFQYGAGDRSEVWRKAIGFGKGCPGEPEDREKQDL